MKLEDSFEDYDDPEPDWMWGPNESDDEQDIDVN